MFSKAKHKDHTEEAMKIYEEARSSLTRLQFIDFLSIAYARFSVVMKKNDIKQLKEIFNILRGGE